jgi:uncharacterized protein (TIGR02466 family)
MQYINIFPTCICVNNNVELVNEYLPIAEEYLSNFGNKFSNVHEEYSPNHISTYSSKEASNYQSTDNRLSKLTTYIKNMARNFLDSQNVKHDHYKLDPFYLFNKIGKNSGHAPHTHPESIVSGCIYLKATELDSCILFYDPRPVHNYYHYYPIFNRDSETYKLLPEYSLPVNTGLIVMWNSWLQHEVPINYNDSERITLAFNLSK